MSDRQGVTVFGEVAGDSLAPITLELLGVGRTLANQLGQELAVLFVGNNITTAAQEAFVYGADKVYATDAPMYANYMTDSYVGAVENFDKEHLPEVLLFGHTAVGRDLAPRLAFRLGTGLTIDCVGLSIDSATGLLNKVKPVYGGNAIASYVCEAARPQMAAVRPKTMTAAVRDESRRGEVTIFDPGLDESVIRGKFIRKDVEEAEGIKLEDADVVVCGGRGLGGPEPFRQLEELAGILGGAVGASRPPCDTKWCASSCQIGLTGKLVSPSLYIGIALSGSSQHQAGMSGSKTIVAINKDEEANIFGIAHYGVVGEYQKVLPAFIEKCKEMASQ
ncbi:MAG: electron transfer flavoprotein subunit alpha/FixB family protein [Dehalococcoidia bacterium]|nr:electron transfer flavoprotein subunit alpha/FixB family protein [Dehalococcoidia bacterium]